MIYKTNTKDSKEKCVFFANWNGKGTDKELHQQLIKKKPEIAISRPFG